MSLAAVAASAGTSQLFAILAVLAFVAAGGISIATKEWWAIFVCLGLAFVAAAVVFLT